jgi:hypothetical protein
LQQPFLKLVRCPRSLAPTLVTLASMSLIPFAPLNLARCPRFASCAPAHLKLAPSPVTRCFPRQFYLLCRFSHKLHSTARFAHLCCSPPRGSILAPTLVALPSMSFIPFAPRNSIVAHLPRCYLAPLPSMSLIIRSKRAFEWQANKAS